MTVEETNNTDDEALLAYIAEVEQHILDKQDFMEYITDEDYPHPNTVWHNDNII